MLNNQKKVGVPVSWRYLSWVSRDHRGRYGRKSSPAAQGGE